MIALVSFALALVLGEALSRTVSQDPKTRFVRRAAASLAVYAAIAGPLLWWAWLRAERPLVGGLVLCVGGVVAIGLLDDARRLRPVIRLAGVALFAWLAAVMGVRISDIKLPFSETFQNLGMLATPLTIVWLTAITFGIALFGRLRGLSPAVAGIAALTFWAVAVMAPQPRALAAAATALAVTGASLGIFRHDLSTDRLPLGTGALFGLGFALGGATVFGALRNTAFLVLLVPMLAFGVPLLSGTYAVAARGRLTIGPRRDYLHDTLLREGLSERGILVLFAAASLYLCLVALLLVWLITLHFTIKLLLLAVLLPAGAALFVAAARIATARPAPPAEGESPTVDVLNVPVSRIDMAMALDRVEDFVRSQSPHMVVTPDSSAIVRAQTDSELADIMRSADLVTPDGAGVIWVARIFGLPLWERVTGCDLMQRICERAAQRGWRVYLLGAAPGVAEQAAARLAERCPGIQVAGTHHGYFTAEQEPEIVSAITAARPDVLFVAFGIPKQEKWIRRHLATLGVPVAIGVGGSFDVIAGRISRAPQWMGRVGLEWLYRTLREPRRLGRALTIPRFLAMAIADRISSRRAAPKRHP